MTVGLHASVEDGTGAVLDRPEVLAQVQSAFERYERALVEGDVAVLTELFWQDPRCVRYGVADRQQGAAQIAAWRRVHPVVPAGRQLRETVVVAVDDRTAVVSTVFGYPGSAVEGRQTQTWARLPEGWRIIAAHVSEVPVG
ncbi:MAG: imidazolonepropionase [Pseudonocardia sp.]|nr:imidazolonepropionase [Pseudonocardia sp.]